MIDLSDVAAAALCRTMENGRVVGRDGVGRRVLDVAVDNWVIDWFGTRRPAKKGIGQPRR